MGLSEVNQVLTLNRLRHRVVLRTDGGIKTGRDVVIAAMLGAEEFGVGTAGLVAMGCILVRQCHSNTCPVGVCTQRPDLREKFEGTPDKVVNLFSFIAEEVREILASLGLRSLEQAIGRSDLLHQVSRGSDDLDDLDLNAILVQIDTGGHPRHCAIAGPQRGPGFARCAHDRGRAGRRSSKARRCSSPTMSATSTGRSAPGSRRTSPGATAWTSCRPARSRSGCAARPASRSAPSPSRA